MDLLLRACRPGQSGLKAGDSAGWEATARAHGVFSLASKRLGRGIPEDAARANLAHVRVLVEVLRALDGAIAYKGPVLAQLAYGDVSLREFCDLDLLVRPAGIDQAEKKLISVGFAPWNRLSRAEHRANFESLGQRALVRDGVVVDLHSDLFPDQHGVPMQLKGVWSRAQEIELWGRRVRTLSDEDMLLVLCVHGAKHQWSRLLWVCDVAWLLAARPGLDLVAVERRARATGTLRMLYLGLGLASALLGSPPCRMDDQTGRLCAEVADRIRRCLPFREGLASSWKFHWSMRERLRDRIEYSARRVLEPNSDDWEFFRLPSAFYPLYYPLRPLRLLIAHGLGVR